jgi:serine/threonine protein kinase
MNRNTLFMVFEDAGGRSLREWMQTKPLLLDRLNAAIQIAAALSQIHHHNVVHRDINSNNVVFNDETKHLQVMSLSIFVKAASSLLTHYPI